MALNPLYVVPINLEEFFVDHIDGFPLANGTIEFWVDDDRPTPKTVYELTGAPPNYTYTALPNPLNLSSVGTPVNNSGDPVSIYYYPYDEDGEIELYYVVVRDSSGTIQFTKQGWPNTTDSGSSNEQGLNTTNALSNPQFVDINFALTNPLTINLSGASTTTVAIAPKWDLVIAHSGSGTVVVTRNAIVGTSAYPYNPPYTMTVAPGLNITSLQLRQRLLNNPDIFAPAPGGTNGFLSGSVLLAPGSGLTLKYQPNGQAAQTILTATNATGFYAQFNNTVQLSAANNTNDGDDGYVDILLDLSVSAATTLSNVQILGLDSEVTDVNYDQNTADRQRDQLFNYYNPLLKYKPIPSYLVGWDFPLNPTQPLGPTVAASAIGANKSKYVWDQTILFQTANSGAGVTRSAAGNGAIRVTAAAVTQFALIQYLPQSVARRVLQEDLSVNVAALTDKANGLLGTISLWYTTDASLPSTIGSNNSLVLTLDANGKPATFNGNWTEVTRNGLGDAQFTVTDDGGVLFNDYGFAGWSLNGGAAVDTAKFFAIVVGFASMSIADKIDIGSISLVPGDIPTRPAPQFLSDVIAECCYFYQKSFEQGTVPANTVGLNTGEYRWPALITGTAANGEQAVSIPFGLGMYAVPTITLYNPAGASVGQGYNVLRSENLTNTLVNITSAKSMQISANGSASTSQSDPLVIHWVADARLGQ